MSRTGSGGSRGLTSRATFEGTTPRAFRLAQGNPEALTQLKIIDDRTSRTKDRARKHFGKYEETWVVREAADLWKRRAGLSADVSALPAMAKEYTALGLMTEARRNVRARMTLRLTKINSVGTRMSNAVVRNLQTLTQSQTRGLTPDGGGPKRGSPSR
jgi:hypothetical protein